MKIPKPDYKKEARAKKRKKLEADRAFKEAVIQREGGHCEVCGDTFGVTAHHYYYRSTNAKLRNDLDNGICLCRGCHFSLHFKDPKIIEEKIIQKKGRKWLAKLKKKAYNKPYAERSL